LNFKIILKYLYSVENDNFEDGETISVQGEQFNLNDIQDFIKTDSSVNDESSKIKLIKCIHNNFCLNSKIGLVWRITIFFVLD
jgi:hypothetical protein